MARFLLLAAAFSMVATGAFANIPDPVLSDAPEMITVTPNANFGYTVTVEGQLGPVNGAFVELEVNPLLDPLVAWCTGQVHPIITGVTAPDGTVTFLIGGGGCIDNDAGTNAPFIAEISADGIVLGNARINSPDITNSSGERATEDRANGDPPASNCDAGSTTVGLSDAVEHTPAISQGLVEPCSNFTGPDFDDPVSLPDAVIVTPYITAGFTCGC
jgi:hypothetical protein